MNMNIKNTVIAAGALGLAAFGNSALADNSTVYPGSACMEYSAPNAKGKHSAGNFYNFQSFSVTVDCPINTHNTSNQNGVAYVIVRGLGSSATGLTPATCVLRSWSYDGSTMIDSSTRTTLAQGKFAMVPMVSQSGSSGKYSLYCSVPPHSRILTYAIRERGNDD